MEAGLEKEVRIEDLLTLDANGDILLVGIMKSVAKGEEPVALLASIAAKCQSPTLQGMLAGAFQDAYEEEGLTPEQKDALRDIEQGLKS